MPFPTPTLALTLALTLSLLTTQAVAGPAAYGLCQTGCNTLAVACYAAAGFQFGTVVAAAGAPATVLACNSALGTCSGVCAALLLAPTL